MGNLTPLGATTATCKCAVAGYLAGLDDEDRHTFITWLDDASITASRISKHLTAQAAPVYLGEGSIRRWRRGVCGCHRG